MKRSPASFSRYSEEELARLRASYLQQNKMRFSFPLVARILAALIIGAVLAAVAMAAIGHLFSEMIPPHVWRKVTETLSFATGIGLMCWVYQWDDRKRFAAFLANHNAGEDASAGPRDSP